MSTEREVSVFDLDASRLDTEWLEQPKIYHEYALALADAKADFERAKNIRDLIYAELDRDIRLDPSSFSVTTGSRGITEGAIEKTVLLQPEHQKAVEAVILAKHKVDRLTADVDALDHRKRALESLVQLEARDYFSAPRAPVGAGGKAVKERKADKAFGTRKSKAQDD